MHSFTKNDMVNRLLNSFRVLVCISIVMSVFNPVLIASASSGSVLSVDSDTVDVGNTSVVRISLGNCSNVTNLSFTLSFNESVLEFIDAQNHSGVTGAISNTSSLGSVDVELNGMDNFTASSSAPIIDVSFKGNESGISSLDFTSASLTTTEGPYSPSVGTGNITVNAVAAPTNSAPKIVEIGNKTVNETELLSFTISATDAEDDELTYSAPSIPTGAEFNASNRTFSWTPATGRNDTYDVTFNVTDNINDPVSETITITVNTKAAVPVVYNPPNPVNFANTTGNFWVNHTWESGNGNITDSYNVTYNGTWHNGTSSEFNTTDLNAHDWSNITVYAYNNTSSTLSSGVDVNVQIPNNDISIIDVPLSLSVNEGVNIPVDANFTDADFDSPIFNCNRTDLFTDFDTSTGTGNWTTNDGDAGTYHIEFNVSDGYASSVSHVMIITVNESMYTPAEPMNFANTTGNFWVHHTWEAGNGNVSDSYNLSYNGTWHNGTSSEFNTTGLSAHDWSNITVYAYNATSSTLSSGVDVNVQIPNNDISIMGVTPYISVAKGQEILVDVNSTDLDGDAPTFSCNSSLFDFDESNGIGSWTPKHKDAGTHYIEFSVFDEYGSSDSAIMMVTINEEIYTPGKPEGFVNTTGNFWVLHDWEAGTGDVSDSYNLSYNGTWHNGTSSEFNTTDLNAHDWSNITVYAYNATSSTLSSGVDVNVQIPNNEEIILNVPFSDSVEENKTIFVDVNHTDIDGDTPTFSCNNTTLFADFNPVDGTGNWTPGFDDEGVHYVEFGVSDGFGLPATQVIAITVTNVNRAPQMNAPSQVTVSENDTLVIPLGAFDPDGDELAYSSDFGNGSIIDGNFTWNTDFESNGTYNVEFTATDGELGASQSTGINVLNTNRAPALESIGDQIITEGDTLTLDLNASDLDGDSLTFGTNASSGTLSDDIFTWVTDFDDSGVYTVEFNVTDDIDVVSEIITITVNNNNRAPTLESIADQIITEGDTLTLDLNASDLDGDSLTFGTNASSGTLSDDIFTWTLGFDDEGVHYVEFGVTDEFGLSVTS